MNKKARTIEKARRIRQWWKEEGTSSIISYQLCNLLALYLNEGETPTSINSGNENGKYFFEVETTSDRVIKVNQSNLNFNELSDDNMSEKTLDVLLNTMHLIEIEAIPNP